MVVRETTPTEMTAAMSKPGIVFIMSEVFVDYSYPSFGLVNNVITPMTGKTKGVEVVGSRGSGFVVHPAGYIITNAHVVTVNEFEIRQEIVNKLSSGNLDAIQYLQENLEIEKIQSNVRVQSGVVSPGQAARQYSWPAEIKRIGAPYPGKDVAILKVEQDNLPTVTLGDHRQLEVGSTIIAVGYPGAADVTLESQLEPTVTQGIVSAMKTAPTGWPLIQIDAAISPGSSGGPVFATDGTVVGVATLGSTETQGFNWIVPDTVVREFMREINVKNTKGVLDKIYETGLEYYWAGKYSKAITEFNKVLDINPMHAAAREYIARSRQAIEIEGEKLFTGKNIAMGIGILLLFAVIVTLIYFLIKEERVIKKEEKIIKQLERKKRR